jgi:hypothetical protein
MPDDVDTLETKRSKLLEEFLSLGDLRPGSLTAVMRRCGKPSCHCAKRNDPGHDPQFRLTRRVAGKTVTETFPNPTALRKAQQEVTEFHRFQKLSQDLVALNEKICRLRPVEQQRGGWTEQEKKTLLRSMRKWREKLPDSSALFLHNAIRTVGPIWKPWSRPCEPLCTKRGPPP